MLKRRSTLDNDVALRVDSSRRIFETHAALLNESRWSSSVNRVQRAIIVRILQRDYGTTYVQQLIEYVSLGRAGRERRAVQPQQEIGGINRR